MPIRRASQRASVYVAAKSNQTVRAICLWFYGLVTAKSPVDTGRFRGNWNVAINAEDSTVDPDANMNSVAGNDEQNGAIMATADFFGGDTVYISNGLPYAMPLEFGHSQQAPQGIVRTSVLELKSYVGGLR